MIKYQLTCDTDHEFEGWFRDSADYDAQSEAGLIECPNCGSDDVRKAMMAPAIARHTGSRRERVAGLKNDLMKAAERARDYVEKNFDYVGERFSEEARRIHYGETKTRSIYGEAKAPIKTVIVGVVDYVETDAGRERVLGSDGAALGRGPIRIALQLRHTGAARDQQNRADLQEAGRSSALRRKLAPFVGCPGVPGKAQ